MLKMSEGCQTTSTTPHSSSNEGLVAHMRLIRYILSSSQTVTGGASGLRRPEYGSHISTKLTKSQCLPQIAGKGADQLE
jgi:hypothetical protein